MDTRVGDLSEGEILERITARTGTSSAAVVGAGDDAAVLTTSGSIVATTDTLVHGPDFRLAWSSGYALGWKAAAVNLADVAAMGARPTALLVALAMPNDTRISFVEELADGMREACAALAPGSAVVGGDLTVSRTLTVAVTALGDLDGRGAVLRSGAAPREVVAVAGELGLAGAGLRVLFDRFRDGSGDPVVVDSGRLREGELPLLEAQLQPSPPLGLGAIAAISGATAMMDVSDGLVLDANRMARASGVTLDLSSAALTPTVEGVTLDDVLGGGEDHALLATFAAGPLPPGFREIGTVLTHGGSGRDAGDGPGRVLLDGAPIAGRGGWDPYADWDTHTG